MWEGIFAFASAEVMAFQGKHKKSEWGDLLFALTVLWTTAASWQPDVEEETFMD